MHPGESLSDRFRRIRSATERIAAPLSPEDCAAQSMPDASPTKWHLAHSSWFFETFVLERAVPGYRSFDPSYRVLFNSYYNGIGEQYPRPQRGLLTRPELGDILAYRRHVDRHVGWLFEKEDGPPADVASVILLGLHHEQQHQELVLTDLKHLLSCNPLRPTYRDDLAVGNATDATPLEWSPIEGGVYHCGHDGDGFHFDNEAPRHQVLLQPAELATRPVTNGEFLAFMADDGYRRPELWLSDGWAAVCRERWRAPGTWERDGDAWTSLTLGGPRAVAPEEPVCHVSYFEADAYARWKGVRLPREAEWEVCAAGAPVEGNFVESERLHPAPADGSHAGFQQLFGDVWEWTSSAYAAYPGYRPAAGAIGEYNGKFMCNQFVLRGGSCVTPGDHVRATYRNFFYPGARWQFSGIRLARDPR